MATNATIIAIIIPMNQPWSGFTVQPLTLNNLLMDENTDIEIEVVEDETVDTPTEEAPATEAPATETPAEEATPEAPVAEPEQTT